MDSRLTRTVELGGAQVRIAEALTCAERATIVRVLSDTLVQVDPKTGAPMRNLIDERPAALFHMLRLASDMDMAPYETGAKDLYALTDDIEGCTDRAHIDALLEPVLALYETEAQRHMQEIRDQHSVAAQLLMFTRQLTGSDDGKNVGMLRSMMTDMLLKFDRHEQQAKINEAGPVPVAGKVVDLSAYRAKKENKQTQKPTT